MAKIIPGLYRVGTGVNAYILDAGEEGVVLIDAGLPGLRGAILNTIQYDLKRPVSDLKHIILTHGDNDHVGSLRGLLKKTSARLYASGGTAAALYQVKAPDHLPLPLKPLTNLSLRVMLGKAIPTDVIVREGDVLPGGLRVIATPGHTSDHISLFWEREKVLFSGDLFMNFTKPILTPRLMSYSVPYARRSARKIFDLPIDIICFGHGKPLRMGGKGGQDYEALKASVG